MPVLFQSTNGRVVQLVEPAMQARTLYKLPDSPITFQKQSSIVTRLTISKRVNMQFLHSIGSQIYVYSFGDRIGQASLSGLAFTDVCKQRDQLGAEQMLMWYKQYKASARRDPLKILIGQQTLEAFVIDFSEDVVDPSTNLVQWGTQLMLLPEDN